jgi:hypothetical protein
MDSSVTARIIEEIGISLLSFLLFSHDMPERQVGDRARILPKNG